MALYEVHRVQGLLVALLGLRQPGFVGLPERDAVVDALRRDEAGAVLVPGASALRRPAHGLDDRWLALRGKQHGVDPAPLEAVFLDHLVGEGLLFF